MSAKARWRRLFSGRAVRIAGDGIVQADIGVPSRHRSPNSSD